MSGGTVPYHLRQNKAIERGVFIDLLQRASRATDENISQYRYVGFAGPFAEDFKLAHSQLGLSKFTSIESDVHVLPRQKWNTPVRGIQFLHCSAREYIDSFSATEPTITWLDYTSPGGIRDQLAEIESLVTKLMDYDILKVTFNATHTTLGPHGIAPEAVQQRIDAGRQRLGEYLPFGFDVGPDDVDRKGYPSLILKGLEFALKSGMSGRAKSQFQPLTAFTYADSSHRMVTLTGIILPKRGSVRFLKDTRIQSWKLATTRWGERTEPIDIVIPEMSLRERLFVDQQLPRRGSSAAIMKRLGFRLVDGVDEKTLAALASYKDFYRFFPHFSRLQL